MDGVILVMLACGMRKVGSRLLTVSRSMCLFLSFCSIPVLYVSISLTDSLRSIFKLAQGEYVAAEKIETVYIKHELIAQAFIYGDSLQAVLVAIIVPDEETLVPWATRNGHSGKTYKELCKDETVKKSVVKMLGDYGKANDLKGFEIVKNIYMDPEQFSVQNDLL